MDTDFGSSTTQLVAYILRNSTLESEASPSTWTALPHNITNGRNYGAFLGYSVQMEQLVLGVDAAYNRLSSMQASASNSISRRVTTSDNVQHDVTITAQATHEAHRLRNTAHAGRLCGRSIPALCLCRRRGRPIQLYH